MSKFQNKIFLVVAVIGLFYFMFIIYSDIHKIDENFKKINLLYLPIILSSISSSILIRSQIQRLVLNNLEIKLSFKDNLILFLMGLSMVITPLGSGQIIKSHILKKKFNQPLSKTLPLVLLERINDLIAIILILVFVLFFSYDVIYLLILLSSLSIIVIFWLIVNNKKMREKIQSKLNKMKFFKNSILNVSVSFESLEKTFSSKLFIKIQLLALFALFLDGFVVYIAFFDFDMNYSYFESIQVYYTSILLGVFSFSPGGTGIVEGSFVNILISKGENLDSSSYLIIFIRIVITWLATALGYVTLGVFGRSWKLSEKF